MANTYQVAQEILSDQELKRILCVFLNTKDGTDWPKATTEYGSASVESMKVSQRNLMKKIEKACANYDVASPSTASPSKKRKSKAKQDDDDDDEEEESPVPKKRGRPSGKKTKSAANATAEKGTTIKKEVNDESDG